MYCTLYIVQVYLIQKHYSFAFVTTTVRISVRTCSSMSAYTVCTKKVYTLQLYSVILISYCGVFFLSVA